MTTPPSLTPIPEVTLGRTGLRTTKLSIGTWGWGGTVGPPEVHLVGDEAILGILRAAFAAGIKYVNTAEAYENEEILGRLIPQANPPADLLITTKFGHGKGFLPDQIRASAERSLRDLRIEKIPLMFLHDPRTEEDMKNILAPGGALSEMRKLQSEGLLGHVGIATGTLTPLRIAVESNEFDAIQFPRLYTLLNTTAKDTGLLAAARAKGIATMSAAPFAGHVLATGAIDDALYTFLPVLPEVRTAVEAMDRRCAELGVEIAAAALAFNYTEPLIDVTVPGMMRESEIHQNVGAFDTGLTREQLESIAAAGKVDPTLVGGPDFITSWPEGRKPTR